MRVSIFAVLALLLSSPPAPAATNAELAAKVEALTTQNAALQSQLDRLAAAQAQQSALLQQQLQTLQALQESIKSGASGANVAAAAPAATPSPEPGRAELARNDSEPSTVVGSYGEIGYTQPTKESEKANVSVGRAVLTISHRFDEATTMFGEFEWENAITSAGDSGEAEVEQLFVAHDFKKGFRGTAGLMLMPAGLVNQNHEPTAYYGVFRPDVDTKIIPSTWREVGVAVSGLTDFGLSWQAGVSTSQNLSKWDPTSDEGRVRGPLQAIHGEGQFASSGNLAVHAAVNWRGPGSLLGASVFTGKIGQKQPDFLGNDSKLVLWEVHGRYQFAGVDLAGEYARGTISHTNSLNASFLADVPDNPTLVPSLFWGGYLQAAYTLWQGHFYRVTPFVRYEILNTAAGFGSLGGSQGVTSQPDEHIWTVGASVFLGEGIVVKADYRHYKVDPFPSEIPPAFNKGNSFNLGLGYSF